MAASPLKKPRDVIYAEMALWAWTVWACLYGIYDAWKQIPEVKAMMSKTVGELLASDPDAAALTTDMGDMMSVRVADVVPMNPDSLLSDAIWFYGIIAIVSAFFIVKVAQRKKWARASFAWGFAFDILFVAMVAFFSGIDYVSEIPELGLQIYALYFLYTKRSTAWFNGRA